MLEILLPTCDDVPFDTLWEFARALGDPRGPRIRAGGRLRRRGVLVARIELWPYGDSRALRQIAAATIVNVGYDGDGYHAYEARSEGRVVRLRHRQADGALTLLRLAIEALEGGGQPDHLGNDAGDRREVGRPATPGRKQAR